MLQCWLLLRIQASLHAYSKLILKVMQDMVPKVAHRALVDKVKTAVVGYPCFLAPRQALIVIAVAASCLLLPFSQ